MYHKTYMASAIGVALLLVTACSRDEAMVLPDASPDATDMSDADMTTLPDASGQMQSDSGGDLPGEVAQATRANLKFKGGRRYVQDLSVALGLERDEVCRELGSRDCVDEVFLVSLGGVEPLFLRIYQPVEGLVTSPIAADRVAMHACINSVDKELVASDFELFIELSSPTSLQNEAVRENVIERLTLKLLGRAATPHERQSWSGLWQEFDAGVAVETQARDWMVLSCFGIATMNENLFY